MADDNLNVVRKIRHIVLPISPVKLMTLIMIIIIGRLRPKTGTFAKQ